MTDLNDRRIFHTTYQVTPELLDNAAFDARKAVEEQTRHKLERELRANGLDWPVTILWRCEAVATEPEQPVETHKWTPAHSAAGGLCGAMVMRGGGGDECGLHRDHPAHRVPGQAVDDQGHYCGQNATTGQMTPSPDGKAGFCGPDCAHCADHKVYAIQDGIYVCAADYDYEKGQQP